MRAELAAVVAGGDGYDPERQAASIPARMAAEMLSASVPLITISSTEFTPSGSPDFVIERRVGQNASLVEAIMLLIRREPTLLPLRTTPPGKGRITPAREDIASAAASAAARASSALRASMRKLPPPIPLTIPNFSWTRNSPSITGIRQKRSPPITLLAWKPSPKKRSAEPTPTRSVASGSPS